MRITLDGKEQLAGQKIDGRIALRAEKGPVDAVAFDAATATKKYKRSLWKTYSLGYGVIGVGWLVSIAKSHTGPAVIGSLAVLVLMIGVIAFFHRKDLKRWSAGAATRFADLPAAGTKASANRDTLTIAGAAYPWSALKVTGVDLMQKASKSKRRLEIERLRVLGNDGKSYVLDTAGYQNGARLIDMAVQRLWPQIQPAVSG